MDPSLAFVIKICFYISSGYFSTWLLIKMLFWPPRAIVFLGFPLPFTPGALPKRKKEFAAAIADAVNTLVSTERVANSLDDEQTLEALFHIVNETMGTIRLAIPNKFKVRFFRHMVSMIKSNAYQVGDAISLRDICYNALMQYDVGEIEDMINEVFGKELRRLRWFGALLGVKILLINILLG